MLLAAAPAFSKDSAACAAITFRPLPTGLADSEQQAGFYASRFAKITLMGQIKGGQGVNYYLTLDNHKPDPLSGALPKSITPCLTSKHIALPAPVQAEGQCTGDRFRVVVATEAKAKYVLLYGLHGDAWAQCSVSKQ